MKKSIKLIVRQIVASVCHNNALLVGKEVSTRRAALCMPTAEVGRLKSRNPSVVVNRNVEEG